MRKITIASCVALSFFLSGCDQKPKSSGAEPDSVEGSAVAIQTGFFESLKDLSNKYLATVDDSREQNDARNNIKKFIDVAPQLEYFTCKAVEKTDPKELWATSFAGTLQSLVALAGVLSGSDATESLIDGIKCETDNGIKLILSLYLSSDEKSEYLSKVDSTETIYINDILKFSGEIKQFQYPVKGKSSEFRVGLNQTSLFGNNAQLTTDVVEHPEKLVVLYIKVNSLSVISPNGEKDLLAPFLSARAQAAAEVRAAEEAASAAAKEASDQAAAAAKEASDQAAAAAKEAEDKAAAEALAASEAAKRIGGGI